MRLYDLPPSPWCQQIRIALAEKGLPYERHIVLPGQESEEWFTRIEPAGRLPVLVDRDIAVRGASVIGEYLEDAYPDRPLMPDGPEERMLVRTVVDLVGELVGPGMEDLRLAREDEGSEAELLSELEDEVARGLEVLEGELEHDLPFAAGESFTLADAALAPFLLGMVDELGLGSLLEGLPRLAAYRERLSRRPSTRVVRQAQEEWREMRASLGG